MAQSGCLVVGVVLAAVVGGIGLDRILDTRPLFTLFLVLGSVPVTLYVLFRMSMRAISAIPPAKPGGKKTEDDDDSET
jgi:F0F1-type ATP synthase assembly protein I